MTDFVEAARIAIGNGCPVEVDACHVPFADLIDLVQLAAGRGIPVVVRNAMFLADDRFRQIAVVGGSFARMCCTPTKN